MEEINSEPNFNNNNIETASNERTERASTARINSKSKVLIPKYKSRVRSPFSNTSTYGNVQTSVGNSLTTRSKINLNHSKTNTQTNKLNEAIQLSSVRYAENSKNNLI